MNTLTAMKLHAANQIFTGHLFIYIHVVENKATVHDEAIMQCGQSLLSNIHAYLYTQQITTDKYVTDKYLILIAHPCSAL